MIEEDEQFKKWEQHILTTLAPMMRQSESSVVIYSGEVDAKLAVELGLAILMDKPIIIAVTPGAQVPYKLAGVADEIVEFDYEHPEKSEGPLLAALLRMHPSMNDDV